MDYDLAMERVGYVVFGAVALSLLGLPRATEDLDIFIAPDRANSSGYEPRSVPCSYKHRNTEDADALRSQWERANFLAHQGRLRAAAAARKTP